MMLSETGATPQRKGRRGSVINFSTLSPRSQELSDKLYDHMLSFAETMMEFALPLDLVMKFVDKASRENMLELVAYSNLKDKIVNDIGPRVAHLQAPSKAGWMDTEGDKRWGRNYFAVRGTSLCVYDNDQQAHAKTVVPCGACEVLEPKSKRKGHDYVFRINVAAYAV
eukprot:SAG31_NODE_21676_length_543_cov_1.484234_1_plen_167_part_01